MKYEKPEICVLKTEYTDVIMASSESLTTKVGEAGARKTATGIGNTDGKNIFDKA